MNTDLTQLFPESSCSIHDLSGNHPSCHWWRMPYGSPDWCGPRGKGDGTIYTLFRQEFQCCWLHKFCHNAGPTSSTCAQGWWPLHTDGIYLRSSLSFISLWKLIAKRDLGRGGGYFLILHAPYASHPRSQDQQKRGDRSFLILKGRGEGMKRARGTWGIFLFFRRRSAISDHTKDKQTRSLSANSIPTIGYTNIGSSILKSKESKCIAQEAKAFSNSLNSPLKPMIV